jgi:hypothetical protein
MTQGTMTKRSAFEQKPKYDGTTHPLKTTLEYLNSGPDFKSARAMSHLVRTDMLNIPSTAEVISTTQTAQHSLHQYSGAFIVTDRVKKPTDDLHPGKALN